MAAYRRLALVLVLASLLIMVGCAEKPRFTPEEQTYIDQKAALSKQLESLLPALSTDASKAADPAMRADMVNAMSGYAPQFAALKASATALKAPPRFAKSHALWVAAVDAYASAVEDIDVGLVNEIAPPINSGLRHLEEAIATMPKAEKQYQAEMPPPAK